MIPCECELVWRWVGLSMNGYGHACVQVELNMIMENKLDGLGMSIVEFEYE